MDFPQFTSSQNPTTSTPDSSLSGEPHQSTPALPAGSSTDLLRPFTGKRKLFVGDFLVRQMYRYLVSLLQGKEKHHTPDNAEFAEMSFEDDILLSRNQTSIWSTNYVEAR